MDYIEIVNWDEFQHYKDRDPPWIKLYNAVLNKYEFRCLRDDSKLLLFALWLIASRTKNKTPYDLKYINEQSGIHKRPTPDRIQELIAAEFIVLRQIDSTVVAPCKQTDSDVLSLTRSREERREEERREETEKRREEEEEKPPTTSLSPKETKSHKNTDGNRVMSAWQKLPLPSDFKAISPAEELAVERELSVLDADPAEPVHIGMVLEAIKNYDKALSLFDSQSHKHRLVPWLRSSMRKTYLGYVFNLENHRKSNFDKQGKSPYIPNIKGRSCQIRGCKLPACYQTQNEMGFDVYRCVEHAPVEVRAHYGLPAKS